MPSLTINCFFFSFCYDYSLAFTEHRVQSCCVCSAGGMGFDFASSNKHLPSRVAHRYEIMKKSLFISAANIKYLDECSGTCHHMPPFPHIYMNFNTRSQVLISTLYTQNDVLCFFLLSRSMNARGSLQQAVYTTLL